MTSWPASRPPVGRVPGPQRVERSTDVVVGRDGELDKLAAAMATLPVAVIYGVAGVGKSTVALEYASRWSGPVAYVKLCGALSIAAISEAIHRQLAVAGYDVSRSDDERLEDLWGLVDRLDGLAVLDDIHSLAAAERDAVIRSASRYLWSGRLIAVSRERVPIGAGEPDRLQLRLEALDRTSAEVLWGRLLELYGPARDFEAAWQHSRGNPFLLRQAHVGMLADMYPLDALVQALDDDERRLAGALALSHIPLPRDVFTRLLPHARANRALDTLIARLVVEVSAAGELVMHDLLREALVRELGPDPARSLAAALAEAVQGSSIDVVTQVHEVARHLRALEDHTAIASLLLRTAAQLVREGANSTLLEELELLSPAVVTPDLVVLRARTLARGLQIRRACEELRRLVDHGGATPQTRIHLATFATLSGELDHAQHVLQDLLRHPGLPSSSRWVAKHALAWALANQGANADARRVIDELEMAASVDPLSGSPCTTLRLYLAVLEKDDEHAAELASELLRRMQHRPAHAWSRLMCAVTLAQCGYFDEAERALAGVQRSLRRPQEYVELRWTRALIACERGGRGGPLAELRDIQRLLDRGVHFVAAMWTRMLTGRLLLLLGRRRDGLAVLAAAHEQCRHHRSTGFDAILASAAAEDPLSPGWLTRPATRWPAKLSERVRSHVRAALRLVCGGGPRGLAGGVPDVEIPAGSDYAFDRALIELARAIDANRCAQVQVAAQHLQRAVAEAATCDADEDLIPQLHDALLALAALPGPETATGVVREPQLVIDGQRHELRAGSQRLALRTRIVLRVLLYAFAAAPAGFLNRAVITRTLWDCDYDPDRHESSLKTNIQRLRSLLTPTGAAIQCERAGYRLVLPPGSVFIAPR